MSTLQDALKKAIQPGAAVEARELAAGPPVGVAALPQVAASEWARLLRDGGVSLPADAAVATYQQKTAGVVKDLERAGRSREARALASARDEFLRLRERKAWEGVKARFEELGLPEKAYRAIKQEGADPEKVLGRLYTRRAEEWRGIAAARLRDTLLGK
ncbi:MAG: hypothetical protein FJ102_18095 [Deltaproteobacteria bacterium]|nr:hypothetical protein [Deltaproteobacteria bacterium]